MHNEALNETSTLTRNQTREVLLSVTRNLLLDLTGVLRTAKAFFNPIAERISLTLRSWEKFPYRVFNECESWHVGPPTQVEKPQGGQGVTHFALFRVIKLGICWQSCYLLPPSSLSVGEILSCQRNNVKTRRFGGLFFLFHISDRGRGGKWTLFIRSWANYLSPSCTAADTTLTTREEKNSKYGQTDRQTQPCSCCRLSFVIPHCVLKSRTETFWRLSGTFSEKPRRGADKIFRRAFQSGVGVDKTPDGSLQPYPCLQSVNVCPRNN